MQTHSVPTQNAVSAYQSQPSVTPTPVKPPFSDRQIYLAAIIFNSTCLIATYLALRILWKKLPAMEKVRMSYFQAINKGDVL